MKLKTTKKAVNETYPDVISVGFCALQTILSFEKPFAYTTGVKGFCADIYDMDGIAIVTGYAPFGNHNANNELCKKYEEKAMVVMKTYNRTFDYLETKCLMRNLLEQFVKEVIE